MISSEIEVDNLALMLDSLSVRLSFVSNRATFDNIGNAGKTTVISNADLHNEIVNYYQFLEYTQSVVNNNNLYRVNSQFGTYVLNNKLGIQINNDGKRYLKEELSPVQKYGLIKQLEGRRYSADNSLRKCSLQLKRTTTLIKLLDKELELHD